MREKRFAEFILRWVISSQEASAFVGDLIESGEHLNALRFWRAVSSVVVRNFWRPMLACLAAFYCTIRVWGPLQMAIFGVHAEHRPPSPWDQLLFVPIGWLAMIMAGISAYSLIRYGVRDRSAHVSFVFLPLVLAVAVAGTAALVLGSLFRRRTRRLAFALSVDVLAAVATLLIAFFIATWYQNLLQPGPWGDVELRQHPSLEWVQLVMLLGGFWSATLVWSRVHLWLGSIGPETSDGLLR
jgi:hypothetical protein